ncbi:hypothetical protein LJC52_04955 [Bacteroidales bacterium OttesenSCG-928-A17]|nr:hypothetical protein [Bacteroidales bacterium OttesenSCG-928-A17]
MRKNIVFVLVVILIIFGLYQLSKDEPLELVWERSYRTTDPQPYGGEALDKLLSASWEDGYTHCYERVSDLINDSLIEDKNLLIICDNFYMRSSEREAFVEYLRAGGNALIVAETFDREWLEVWNIETRYNARALKENFTQLEETILKKETPSQTITFHHGKTSSKLKEIPLHFTPLLFTDFEKNPDADTTIIPVDAQKYILVSDKEDNTLMLRYTVGKGNLILSCSPLLFTNYSLLYDPTRPFFERSVAYLKGKPLVRTEYYKVGSQQKSGKSPSLFRVLKSNPSSRWAYYLAIAGILLFMVFTAKRKQKVIPVIDPPRNRILDFVDSITSLYLSKNNNTDILQKRYVYWAEEIHKKYGIDIINEEHTPSFYNKFATKTGMGASDARQLILTLESLKFQPEISDKELMDIITTLNKF